MIVTYLYMVLSLSPDYIGSLNLNAVLNSLFG